MLGGPLEPCGIDPVTGFFRDGRCATGPEDVGRHVVCAVVTAEFLEHQLQVGNDLRTPRPEYRFPGLVPGDRWCVVAVRWAQALADGVAAPVVLAATHERALDIVPLAELRRHAVDVPPDLSSLADPRLITWLIQLADPSGDRVSPAAVRTSVPESAQRRPRGGARRSRWRWRRRPGGRSPWPRRNRPSAASPGRWAYPRRR